VDHPLLVSDKNNMLFRIRACLWIMLACGGAHGFLPHTPLFKARVFFFGAEKEGEFQPQKKSRGRPRKIEGSNNQDVVSPPIRSRKDVSLKQRKKNGNSQVPKLDENPMTTHQTSKTTLVIVRTEGIQGDDFFFDKIKKECVKLYGDSLVISESRYFADDVVEIDDDFLPDEEIDFEQEQNSASNWHQEADGSEPDGSEPDGSVADDHILSDDSHDETLVEVWVESYGKIRRLCTRRETIPLNLTPEVMKKILDGVAEYMEKDHYLSIEVGRDIDNMPQLS
jgi:hypothetical protein